MNMENEIQDTFRRMYPLANERTLPRTPSHIPPFLQGRIHHEVEQNTQGFTQEVVEVLCEVTHPKTHVADMCRNVVNELKDLRRLRDSIIADATVNIEKIRKDPEPPTRQQVVEFFGSQLDRVRLHSPK